MLKKSLKNKKIIITVSVIVVVLIVLIILLTKCSSDKAQKEGTNSDEEIKQEELYDGEGLDVIEDDGSSEERTDISEYWEDTPKEDDADKKSESAITDNTHSNDTEKDSTGDSTEDSSSEDGVSTDETPEDEDVSWGTIY